jgi:hypothetical protein
VTLLLPLLAFLFASLLIAAGAMALSPAVGTIERRLGEVLTGDHVKQTDAEQPYSRAVIDTLKRIGRAAPQSPSEMGKLQRKLTAAGYRSYEAVAVFYGIRLGCALIAFALLATPIIVHPNIALALAGCGLGYLLPSMVLGRMAKPSISWWSASKPGSASIRRFSASARSSSSRTRICPTNCA